LDELWSVGEAVQDGAGSGFAEFAGGGFAGGHGDDLGSALQGGFYVTGGVAYDMRGVSRVGVAVSFGGSGLGDGYEVGRTESSVP
jgi:hypothetical protein